MIFLSGTSNWSGDYFINTGGDFELLFQLFNFCHTIKFLFIYCRCCIGGQQYWNQQYFTGAVEGRFWPRLEFGLCFTTGFSRLSTSVKEKEKKVFLSPVSKKINIPCDSAQHAQGLGVLGPPQPPPRTPFSPIALLLYMKKKKKSFFSLSTGLRRHLFWQCGPQDLTTIYI